MINPRESTEKRLYEEFKAVARDFKLDQCPNILNRLEDAGKKSYEADFSTDVDPSFEDYLGLRPIVDELSNRLGKEGGKITQGVLERLFLVGGAYSRRNVLEIAKYLNLNPEELSENSGLRRALERKETVPYWAVELN